MENAAMAGWHRVCAADEVTEEKPYPADIGGVLLAVFKQGENLSAINDVCTHAFARLSEGFLIRGAIECILHGARFDIRTGGCVSIPAYDGVQSYEVRVEGGDVLVRIAAPG
jgi:nitrite reductase/ring-hydroxylating ferredoxin subunit